MNKIINSPVFNLPQEASFKEVLKQLKENKALGFTQSPFNLHAMQASQNLAEELCKKYEQFVVIGIGGSSMGARALAEVSANNNLYFLDNVDANELNRILNCLVQNSNSKTQQEAFKKTGFLIVSKSGSTIEILWNFSLLEQILREQDLNLISQSYFITELTQNPIAELAKKNSRPLLEVPLNVGGRFSVLTPVGLVVAKLCGFNLEKLMAGAQQALQDENAVLASCRLFLDSFKRNESITLFWFYNSNFRWFGAWIQQLWAESLGKLHNNQGQPAPAFSTPMTAIGACDQHSILQQVAHGVKNKFVCIYSFESIEKSNHKLTSVSFNSLQKAIGFNYGDLIACQVQATQEALVQNGVSTQFFKINDGDRDLMMGYLFMYFQLVVAVLGLHENINPFDQPGVALGKELTLKKLNL